MQKQSPRRSSAKPAGVKVVERNKTDAAHSSLERMLALLDLFTISAPVRPVTELVNYLGTSRSTSYRYIKALHAAGLLEAVANGRYVLGPRIMELDRQLRMTNPLYQGAGPILRELVQSTGHSALLCALNQDSVMCIREDLTGASPPVLFSRGQRQPLLFGAGAKVILPYVPSHRLIRIFEQHNRDIAKAGLGTDWQGFKHHLAGIRRDGYCATYGEVNPGVFGVAAPVFNGDDLVVGSILIAGAAERPGGKDLRNYGQVTVAAAKRLTHFLARDHNDRVHPPRAFGSPSARARG